jgi:hypothetical protein
MTLTILYAALLWALLYLLFCTADRLLQAQSRLGVPSNAEARWAYCVYHLSQTALVVTAIAAALALVADSALRLTYGL